MTLDGFVPLRRIPGLVLGLALVSGAALAAPAARRAPAKPVSDGPLVETLGPARARVGLVLSGDPDPAASEAGVAALARRTARRRGFDWWKPIGDPPLGSDGAAQPRRRAAGLAEELDLKWIWRCPAGWSQGAQPPGACPETGTAPIRTVVTTQILMGHGPPPDGRSLPASEPRGRAAR